MFPTTFVTSFLKIYDEAETPISTESRIQYFKQIVDSGIPIYIFCSGCYEEALKKIAHENMIIETVELDQTDFFKHMAQSGKGYEFPAVRNEKKDTFEYMCLMNCKTEFVERVIHKNPWNSKNYAWLDFNFFHIFNQNYSQKEMAFKMLQSMKTREFSERNFICIPGCWPFNWFPDFHSEIIWRFAGGFFIGNKNRTLEFCQTCAKYRSEFFVNAEGSQITWEVNYWAWLEVKEYFKPDWFHADHDSAMLTPGNDYSSPHLKLEYNEYLVGRFPKIPNFDPTTMSIAKYNNKTYLNIRYVNYQILNDGRYYIKHPQHHIHTRNIVCELDENHIGIEYKEMHESVGELEDHVTSINGLEDIRIYVNTKNELCFVASNYNHFPEGKIQIVRGIYDIDNNICRNLCEIKSPMDCYMEKNWIPIPEYAELEPKRPHEYDYFIYSWQPYRIGRVRHSDHIGQKMEMDIVLEMENWTPRFDRVRGSTGFVETEEGWVGLVHLSEEHYPRHYYHMLVLLDREFKPLKYSQTFIFHNYSIEFCAAFMIKDDEYMFWISNFDKCPEYIKVKRKNIKLEYVFNI